MSLDQNGLMQADIAFIETIREDGTQAEGVRAAIAAYLTASPPPPAEPLQAVATFPSTHPELPGGQVLVRTFDGWQTAEVCTRPDTYSSWSIGVGAVSA